LNVKYNSFYFEAYSNIQNKITKSTMFVEKTSHKSNNIYLEKA